MKIILGMLIACLSFVVSAENIDECFEVSGKRFNINPALLKAIGYTESRLEQSAKNENYNSSGELISTDYGIMQINDTWFPKFESFGMSSEMIISSACSNIEAGAWILANNFSTSGESWLAVGAYNAGYKRSEKHNAIRERYIEIVKSNLEIVSSWGK